MTGEKVLLFSYFILLFSGILIPSDGSHGILSIKSLSFLFTVFGVGFYLLLNQTLSSSLQKILAVFSAFGLFMLTWLILGLDNPHTAIDQFKLFLITIFFVLLTVMLLKEKILSFETFFKCVIYANFTYSALKLLLVLLHILHIIPLYDALGKLGIRFMSMQIYGGLGRMQTSIDILSPFVLYFVLKNDSFKIPLPKLFRSLFCLVTWVSILLSFSRFFIGLGLCAHLIYWLSLNRMQLVIALSKCVFLLAFLTCLIGPDVIYKVVERRFLSTDVTYSDKVRQTQVETLLDEFAENPLLGKGMGGFSETAIRDGGALSHSYEVQWVAFLMQFGLVGLSIILMALGLIAWPMLSFPVTLERVSLFCMFGLWILAGMTNPFIISLTSGIIYALFVTAAQRLRSYS